MRNDITDNLKVWRSPWVSIGASLALNAAMVLTLSFGSRHSTPDTIDLTEPVEVLLISSEHETAENERPLMEPVPFAQAFVVQNNLPGELFSEMHPDETKLNGLLDTEDGGTAFHPAEIRSGGGGGDGADSLTMGHMASHEHVWARLKMKVDPKAKESGVGDENGTATRVPGVLKTAGGGVGLGNGQGSGAVGSQGSGSGSGAGTNGANFGNGMGKAVRAGVSRKPSVVSMDRGVYPSAALAAHHEGTVILTVEVLPSGDVGDVQVKTSSGYDELDRAAVGMAKNWQFTGALRDGQPVSFWYSIPYEFALAR